MVGNRSETASGITSLAEVLGAFAFAADLAFGLELEDGIRGCYIADRIAEALDLSEDDRIAVYYTSLLKDAGCTCWTTPLAEFWQTNEIEARRDAVTFGATESISGMLRWMKQYAGSDLPLVSRFNQALKIMRESGPVMAEGFASAAEVCTRVSQRLGMPESVQEACASLIERWDGKGSPNQLQGDSIPIAALVVNPTYYLAAVHRALGREAARRTARERQGTAFAPAVIDAFLALTEDPAFWESVEAPGLWQRVLEREPDCGIAVTESRLDDVALAFADFIDLKSPFTAAHSRRVGRLSGELAGLMGCNPRDVALIQRAGLMHDLGLVAVPSLILNKEETHLTASQQEERRLHPYFGERILDRLPVFAPMLPLVGGHHEQVDGGGYFRNLRGRDLPLGARIIAVANRLDELTHDRPGHSAMDLSAALATLESEAGTAFDRDVVSALVQCLGAEFETPSAQARPAGLSEREVEVLQLAAKGMKRREIAERLSISENTVRHHLEHIYAKTGTSTRVGATLFAMENDLLR